MVAGACHHGLRFLPSRTREEVTVYETWLGIQGMPTETIQAQIRHIEERLQVLRAVLADRQAQQGTQTPKEPPEPSCLVRRR